VTDGVRRPEGAFLEALPPIVWLSDDTWHKARDPVFLPLFGRDVAVTVHREADAVTPAQAAALAQLLTLPPGPPADLTHQVALQCWRSYSDEVELQVRGDVWGLVEVTDLFIPRHARSRDRYGFLGGECAWDPEHGLDILYKNGRPFEVGPQRGLALNQAWRLYYISE
jgi:hypothetical protein